MIRAEAAAEDKMGALDLALDKMAAQMRRAADRRREHKAKHDRVADLLQAPALDDRAGRGRTTIATERQVGPDHGHRRGSARGPREDARRDRR